VELARQRARLRHEGPVGRCQATHANDLGGQRRHPRTEGAGRQPQADHDNEALSETPVAHCFGAAPEPTRVAIRCHASRYRSQSGIERRMLIFADAPQVRPSSAAFLTIGIGRMKKSGGASPVAPSSLRVRR
jgi:hypothetical protein